MRKKFLIALTICMLLVSGLSVAYAPSQERKKTSSMTDRVLPSKLSLINEESHRLLTLENESPILLRKPQDSDYAKIWDLLVDNTITPMSSKELLAIQADPNATLVDNVLPDGRFLKDNWIELQNEIIDSSRTVRTLDNGVLSSPLTTKKFDAIVQTANDRQILKLQKVNLKNKSIIIPQNFDDLPVEFAITSNGNNTFFFANNGIFSVNKDTYELYQVSPESYNGITYNELMKKSIDYYGSNYLMWNENPLISPDDVTVIYSSNKDDIFDNGSSLFSYDFKHGVETKITETKNTNFLIQGWLNSQSVVGEKILEDVMSPVLINLDGRVIDLQFKEKSPLIYSVKNGLVAYADSLSSGDIHIAQINDSGEVNDIASFQFVGQTRLRTGNDGFNKDASLFAFIYAPDSKTSKRSLQIIDLRANNIVEVDIALMSKKPVDHLEFSWSNNNELLIVTGEYQNEEMKMSTWTYSVGRGK